MEGFKPILLTCMEQKLIWLILKHITQYPIVITIRKSTVYTKNIFRGLKCPGYHQLIAAILFLHSILSNL